MNKGCYVVVFYGEDEGAAPVSCYGPYLTREIAEQAGERLYPRYGEYGVVLWMGKV
jgi:hypothetical protein